VQSNRASPRYGGVAGAESYGGVAGAESSKPQRTCGAALQPVASGLRRRSPATQPRCWGFEDSAPANPDAGEVQPHSHAAGASKTQPQPPRRWRSPATQPRCWGFEDSAPATQTLSKSSHTATLLGLRRLSPSHPDAGVTYLRDSAYRGAIRRDTWGTAAAVVPADYVSRRDDARARSIDEHEAMDMIVASVAGTAVLMRVIQAPPRMFIQPGGPEKNAGPSQGSG
jgi:hypothetical protein